MTIWGKVSSQRNEFACRQTALVWHCDDHGSVRAESDPGRARIVAQWGRLEGGAKDRMATRARLSLMPCDAVGHSVDVDDGVIDVHSPMSELGPSISDVVIDHEPLTDA